MPLTDKQIQKAHPQAKRYKLTDVPSSCTPNGGKYWVLRCTRRRKGAEISHGTRESHTLTQADDLRGYRTDRPTRCELPPYRAHA